jgi:DNA-binding GntR family transcriptional regulator
MLATDRARDVADALGDWETPGDVLYLALADALDGALNARRIAPHLPSERVLARALNVSRGTVANAYEVLRERGLIERQRGSGTMGRPRAHEICPDPIACVREFFASRP